MSFALNIYGFLFFGIVIDACGFHGLSLPMNLRSLENIQSNESSYFVMQQTFTHEITAPLTSKILIVHKHWSLQIKMITKLL